MPPSPSRRSAPSGTYRLADRMLGCCRRLHQRVAALQIMRAIDYDGLGRARLPRDRSLLQLPTGRTR